MNRAYSAAPDVDACLTGGTDTPKKQGADKFWSTRVLGMERLWIAGINITPACSIMQP